jgi:beta-glucosidase
VQLEAGETYLLRVDYQRGGAPGAAGLQFGVRPPLPADMIERAVTAAAQADAAIVVIGTTGEWETEGNDRADMRLPGAQDELVRKVAAANANTAIVLNCGSPMSLDWLDDVPALLQVWFPGQEFGRALADVLFGSSDPSGRLPTTWPRRLEDTPAFTSSPGENGSVDYAEGIFVGYRWYDARKLEPRIPFGHGLSYTRFEYGALELQAEYAADETIEVVLDVTNVGERSGLEVVQLYVCDPESRLRRPEQELKAFAKIELAPGETTAVHFHLDARALAYWDPAVAGWVSEPGTFELRVGASSRDIRSKAAFELKS